MLALVDYGLIVVFFVGVFALVLVIAHTRSDAASAHQNVPTLPATVGSPQQRKLSYALLLTFFLVLCLVTFLSERGRARIPTTSSP